MMAPMAMTAASDPALLRAWGINVEMDAVTADSASSVAIRGGRGEPVQYQPAFAAGPLLFRPRGPSPHRHVGDVRDSAGAAAAVSSLGTALATSAAAILAATFAAFASFAAVSAFNLSLVCLEDSEVKRSFFPTIFPSFSYTFPDFHRRDILSIVV
jgi:hypothetical protein